MNDALTSHNTSPADIVAEFEQRAHRVETPCMDGSIVWRAWGNGPPVILFHGAQGSWTHWIRNIDALAETRTVWAVDLPGTGDSAMPPDGSMDTICSVLAAGLRDIVGGQLPVDIVGFSFGGVTAAYLAGYHPDIVRRIILVDTGGLDTPVGNIRMTRVRGLQGEERQAAHRHNLLALMIKFPENIDALVLYLHEVNGSRAKFNPADLVLPDKLLIALKRIPVQFDTIWGEFDQPHPDPALQEAVMRPLQPDMEFRVIEGAGHWVMYEQAEAFNRTVMDMLNNPLRSVP